MSKILCERAWKVNQTGERPITPSQVAKMKNNGTAIYSAMARPSAILVINPLNRTNSKAIKPIPSSISSGANTPAW